MKLLKTETKGKLFTVYVEWVEKPDWIDRLFGAKEKVSVESMTFDTASDAFTQEPLMIRRGTLDICMSTYFKEFGRYY